MTSKKRAATFHMVPQPGAGRVSAADSKKRRGRCAVALRRGRGDYAWARFTFLTFLALRSFTLEALRGLTFDALRGLTLEALACLFFLFFLTFCRLRRYAAGFLVAASTIPVTPQLNARASANVRSRIFILLRTSGEPQ